MHRLVRPLFSRVVPAAVAAMTLAGCATTAPSIPASPGAAPGYGYICYAGVYQCRVPQQIPSGTPCSCPGLGAPSYGSIH